MTRRGAGCYRDTMSPEAAPKAAIVGISGTELTDDEAALFRAHPPAGVILFARNIAVPIWRR